MGQNKFACPSERSRMRCRSDRPFILAFALAFFLLELAEVGWGASVSGGAKRGRPRAKSQRVDGYGIPPRYDGCARNVFNLTIRVSPAGYMKVPQIVEYYGYPAEIHTISSKDGYLLQLHRIPYGKPNKNIQSPDNFPMGQAPEGIRPVVLLHHGMTGTSSSWVFMPEDEDIAFLLVNAGYDVWMANARGNSYSQRHKRLNQWQRKFWDWSFDEMATNDVPRVIDYILRKTGEPKLYYIGHSMGGTVFLMLMSRYPEYNAKIRSAHLFSPASYMYAVRTPVLLLAPLFPILDFAYKLIGWGRIEPPFGQPLINLFGPIVCAPTPVAATFCAFWAYLIMGYNPCQLNATESLSLASGTGLDTISVRCLAHYIQMIYSGKFEAFNHGAARNMQLYGTSTPYEYDITKISAPVAVYWGQNDWLVSPESVARLVKELPNLISNFRVNHDMWTHFDFINGIDAKQLLYDPVMKFMAKYY